MIRYDAVIIPTGEELTGEGKFPVTNEAIKLFKKGYAGNIFVTGGYGGFSKSIPGVDATEAKQTYDYILEQGVKPEKVFYEEKALDTVGNFTFPTIDPQYGNPSFNDFSNMLVIGKQGHVWRMRDIAHKVLPDKDINYYSMPGKHNDGVFTRVYHSALMNALGEKPGVEKAHEFLLKEHPFYSEGWHKRDINERKVIATLKGLSWFLK